MLHIITFTMKKTILNWLKFDKSFDKAREIYFEHGKNIAFKTTLNRQGKTDLNEGILHEELLKLSEIPKHEFFHLLRSPLIQNEEIIVFNVEEPVMIIDPIDENSTELIETFNDTADENSTELVETSNEVEEVDNRKRIPISEIPSVKLRDEFPFLADENCPFEYKVLVNDMITQFEKFKSCYREIDVASDEKIYSDSVSGTVENYLGNREIWDEFNHFKANGVILGKHKIFKMLGDLNNLKDKTMVDLFKLKSNLENGINKLKAEIKKGDNPELNDKRESNISSKNDQLILVKKILNIE